MQPFLVVDLFQKLADGRTRFRQIPVFVAQHLFVLQSLYERFAGRVVPGVAFTRHADVDAVGLQQVGVIVAGVLRAAIGMMDQPGLNGAA